MSSLSEKQKVILFIDDDKGSHALVQMVISNFTDYKLVSASSGSEAIICIKLYARQLSLVLSDILLPDVDGFEVYKIMIQNPRCTNVPFVFQSGIEDAERYFAKKQILQEKIKRLNKPYGYTDLLKMIRENAV
jgi:PleD family two-component response regulator